MAVWPNGNKETNIPHDGNTDNKWTINRSDIEFDLQTALEAWPASDFKAFAHCHM